MLAMRLSGPDFFASHMDAAKTAMLTSSPSMGLSHQQNASPHAQASSTMLDRELLQHYAYLRYGEGGNKDSSGRKQHVCPVKTCGRRFSTPGNLSRHKRLHGPIKPLKCPVDGCICAFRSENKLEKHMKFHLGIPVHVCPVPACGKTFSTAGNLNRHIKGHHPHVDPLELKFTMSSSSTCSTSSSCDEYESSVGGDEVMLERFEEEAAARAELQQLKLEPTAVAPSDQLDALVAILDQDIGADSQDVDMAMDASQMDVEGESMLSLLLLDKPTRKYSLLDDMIRFHINHQGADDAANGSDDTWTL